MPSRLALPAAALALLGACEAPPPTAEIAGRGLYAEYCAACHGPRGRGDGPAAAGLAVRPADLSALAAANGGRFPVLKVMARIYGYGQGRPGEDPMPEFGPLLEGETMLADLGDGVATPTPVRLVALVNYLGWLQPD
ncbi:MAG: cytochrome c [Rhodobacteraceae bacterium]|nr:cytochrome c [Paracoccaceae bacterium]